MNREDLISKKIIDIREGQTMKAINFLNFSLLGGILLSLLSNLANSTSVIEDNITKLEIISAWQTANGKQVICFKNTGQEILPKALQNWKCFYGDKEGGFHQLKGEAHGVSPRAHIRPFLIGPYLHNRHDQYGVGRILHLDFQDGGGVFLLDCGDNEAIEKIVKMGTAEFESRDKYLQMLKNKGGISPEEIPENNLTMLREPELSALTKQFRSGEIKLWTFPQIRSSLGFFRDEAGSYYYLGAEGKYNFSYKNLTFYKGKPGNWTPLKVTDTSLMLDGGSMGITFENKDSLFYPATPIFSSKKKNEITYRPHNGKRITLTQLDDRKFELELPEEEVTRLYRNPCEAVQDEKTQGKKH